MPLALRSIPPFPAVAIQLLRTASNEFARLRELSDLIRADAAFSGEILRTANSSLYGLRTDIDSILQATLLLGVERVKAIVVTAAMKNYLGHLLNADWMRACWRHNLACAVIASELAGGTLVEEDAAYTAGLLHDMGRLALGVAYGEQYGDFLLNPTNISENLLDCERTLFGIDHCEAGSALASSWDLPASIARVIARHHEQVISSEFDALAIVSLACQVADVLGFEAFRHPQLPTYVELRAEIAEKDRKHLPPDAKDLTVRIASAINTIETT
jgi:putative nucleotidyltransferase with HDIG domain